MVLEARKRRFKHLLGLFLAALDAPRVNATDPGEDAAGEPLEQRGELGLGELPAALVVDLALDLLIDESKQKRVVAVKQRNERRHRELALRRAAGGRVVQ